MASSFEKSRCFILPLVSFCPGLPYLGITISNNLSWNAHVNATVKKANNSLAFLRRNLARCPKDVKAQSYQTMVRPILEYTSTSWDPPYTVTNIQQLEAVQRRAARFVCGDYKTTSSPSQMIAELGWEPLQTRRANAKLVMIYRITYGLIDIPAPDFLHPSTLSTRGNTLRYIIPYCRTDIYQHSFFPSAIRLWNQLPDHTVTSQTLDAFKLGLDNNYEQTDFILFLTSTLLVAPHDVLVHSSPVR